MFFFFNDTATTAFYTYLHTLSLHDALPILLAIKIRLKRQEVKHQIDRLGDAFDATLTPGPHRWADIMYGLHALLAQALFQTESEVGCVYADHHIGTPFERILEEEIGRAHV